MKKKLLFIFSLFLTLIPFNVLAEEFNFCNVSENPEVVAGFRFGGIIIFIVKIVVPIILIIMGMIDISKAVVESNQDAIKKNAITFGKRAIAAVLIFFVPAIMKGIFETISSWNNVKSDYETCINCLLDVQSCPSSAKIGNN